MPYPYCETANNTFKSPVEALLMPFEALTLLITAIGHDVGHPGVNNGFLVTLNAPLAQLYNDRSVLESFHCAAFSQILRRHWPSAFEDRKMRSLMISSILATDMGLHFDYMKKMADLKEKLSANDSTEGWNSRMVEEQKGLACALLIKCADISNVVCISEPLPGSEPETHQKSCRPESTRQPCNGWTSWPMSSHVSGQWRKNSIFRPHSMRHL